MINTEKNCLPENNSTPQTTSATRHVAHYFHEFSPDSLKAALMPWHERTSPIDELIATSEAAFEMIRISEMNLSTKNAFWQLEKQFEFYKNLVQLRE